MGRLLARGRHRHPEAARAGTPGKTAVAKLPEVRGTPAFPAEDQQNKAKTVLGQGWAKAVSG